MAGELAEKSGKIKPLPSLLWPPKEVMFNDTF